MHPFIQKHRGGLILLVFLLPLCFAGIRTHHDWGDDFAQYINQARCITKGEPVSHTGYIYNPHNPMLGPAAYPGGFPLLLSPVYALFGNNIVAFNVYLSLWLILAGFIWYMVLRRYHSEWVSVALSVLWCWHPWVLEYKTEVMAEIPFTALLGLLILLYKRGFMRYDEEKRRESLLKALTLGIVAGLLVAVRLNGIVIVVALYAFEVWQNIWHLKPPFEPKNKLYTSAATALITAFIVCFVLIDYLISGIRTNDLLTYGSNFSGEPLLVRIRENLGYYTMLVQDFFQRSKPEWKLFPLLTQAFLLALACVGIIKDVVLKRSFLLWAFTAYMALLIVYPYRGGGLRFLLPVLPIILHYAAQGFKSIHWGFTMPVKTTTVVLSLVILLQFLPEQLSAIKNAKNNFAGPQQPESTEAFAHIKANTPANAVFLFKKPRALALYAERKAFATHPTDTALFLQDIAALSPAYILTHTDLQDVATQNYLTAHQHQWDSIWGNNKFTLYAKNPR